MSLAAGLDGGLNLAGLARDERAERRMLLLLCSPGMLLALVILFLPKGLSSVLARFTPARRSPGAPPAAPAAALQLEEAKS